MPFPITFLTESMEVAEMKNKLKMYRAMHSLTQEQLADSVGVSRQTVIAIENDKYLPSLQLAFKLARIFQVAVEDIFEYQGKEKNT